MRTKELLKRAECFLIICIIFVFAGCSQQKYYDIDEFKDKCYKYDDITKDNFFDFFEISTATESVNGSTKEFAVIVAKDKYENLCLSQSVSTWPVKYYVTLECGIKQRHLARNKETLEEKEFFSEYDACKEQIDIKNNLEKRDINGKRYFANLELFDSIETFQNTHFVFEGPINEIKPSWLLEEIKITPAETPKVLDVGYTFDVLERDLPTIEEEMQQKPKDIIRVFYLNIPEEMWQKVRGEDAICITNPANNKVVLYKSGKITVDGEEKYQELGSWRELPWDMVNAIIYQLYPYN